MWALLALLLHDEKVVTADVRVNGPEVLLRVHVGMERVARGVKLPADVVDLSELQLRKSAPDVARWVLSRTTLEVDGLRAAPELLSLEPQYEKVLATGEEFIASALLLFRVPAGKEPDVLRLAYDAFSDYPGSTAVLSAAWGEGFRRWPRHGPEPVEIRRASLNPTFWGTAGEFLVWGMHHIFIGFDHIAFLLALLLGASKAAEMVKIVTSFTVAHSLTLLLAALNVIRIPSRVTESLIAASIVYVAVENYLLKDAGHRWILTFGFGLVHGLGFSEVLRARLGEVRAVAVPVVSFNLGVELGQLAILAVAFPLLALCRRGERSRAWLLRLGSAAVLLLGIGWLVERLFNLEFMPL